MNGRFTLATIFASLLVASSAVAAPITVTLTITNASGTLGPAGAPTPFTAPFVTFTATGDTSAVGLFPSAPGLVRAFVAPISILIPGVLSTIVSGSQVG